MVRILFITFVFFSACSAPQSQESASEPDVEFQKLHDGVWIHTSYKSMAKWGLVRSNGVIFEKGAGAVLVDTAWNDTQTAQVLTWAADHLSEPVTAAIFTHAHEDKMGGSRAVAYAGISSSAHRLSNELAPSAGIHPADNGLALDSPGDEVEVGTLTVFYPGVGHTRDNIVVYDSRSRVLHGGCFVRPKSSSGVGNVADGDIELWLESAKRVRARFPDARWVVPSHGDVGGIELLDHTISVLRRALD